MDENELYDLAELFKVFGDSTRIRILYELIINTFQNTACSSAANGISAEG